MNESLQGKDKTVWGLGQILTHGDKAHQLIHYERFSTTNTTVYNHESVKSA